MFAVLPTGQLPCTNFQQVDETHIVCNLQDVSNVNYLTVFLTGVQALPENLGGAVYYSQAVESGSTSGWEYLGYVSNEKPSALFKISKLKKADGCFDSETPSLFVSSWSHHAQIGISVEPLPNIRQFCPAEGTGPSAESTFNEFVSKMLENFSNFICSFALTQRDMTPLPAETFVPLSSVQTWLDNFKRRLAINPNFWRT